MINDGNYFAKKSLDALEPQTGNPAIDALRASVPASEAPNVAALAGLKKSQEAILTPSDMDATKPIKVLSEKERKDKEQEIIEAVTKVVDTKDWDPNKDKFP